MRVLAALVLAALSASPFAAAAHMALPDARAGGLAEVLAWRQPVVRGSDDVVAALAVFPDGAPSWSGLYWVTSQAGVDGPHTLDVPREGAMVPYRAQGAPLLGDHLDVTFHFLGPNGTTWARRLAPLPVLAEAPQRDRAGFSALVRSTPREGAPDLLMMAPWNTLGHDAHLTLKLRDAAGHVVDAMPVGSCVEPASDTTEAGCRPIFLLPAQGARVELWQGRRLQEAHALADLVAKPYMMRV